MAGSTGAYIQFLLPGILILTVVPMTVYSGTTICSDITKGVHNRFRTRLLAPASVLGSILTDGVRYTIGVIVALGTGLVLGFRPEGASSKWHLPLPSSCSLHSVSAGYLP